MVLCIPVTTDLGLESPVSGHFGSTPLFLLADLATGVLRCVANANVGHAPGQCRPLASIEGQGVTAVAVAGIGGGAFEKLKAAGIRVVETHEATAGATLAAFHAGTLPDVSHTVACAPHATAVPGSPAH